ncbi:15030_t:CDS:2, partial [Acaulospora morrowiae]
MTIFTRKSSSNGGGSICYHVVCIDKLHPEGFFNCHYFNSAIDLGEKLKQPSLSSEPIVVNVSGHPKEKWSERVKYLQSKISNSSNHKTSPFVYEGCNEKDYKFIGGYSDFVSFVRAKHQHIDIPKDESKEHGKECEGG